MQVEDPSSMLPVGGFFNCAMPVRWGDLDVLGHVNNTVYFRFAEEARVHMFAAAGITMPSSRAHILVHASCDFLRPLHYPATVNVRLAVARVGRSSMDLDVVIESGTTPAQVCATGKNVVVVTDSATGKPTPWTSAELASLASSLAR